MNDPIIEFKRADIGHSEAIVLHKIDMQIFPGDFAYIVGKVGSGKTSIVRTLIAENKLLGGEGTVCGYHLNELKPKDIPFLRRRMGVVFQDFQLLMDRNVEDNLSFVLKATGWKKDELIEKRIFEVLKSVGMETKAHKMPHHLSGGEQQRIAIARALLNNPGIIVADEPTGNLDPETAEGIMKLLRSINAEKGTAILMVTHNLSIVERYPGRVFNCTEERLIEK